jgi:hypothetical protein
LARPAIDTQKHPKIVKTTARVGNGTQHVVQRRKPGGQPGNRNAFRTGRDTAKVRTARTQVGKLKRAVRAALVLAEAALKAGGR